MAKDIIMTSEEFFKFVKGNAEDFKKILNEKLEIQITGKKVIDRANLRSYRDQENDNYHEVYIATFKDTFRFIYILNDIHNKTLSVKIDHKEEQVFVSMTKKEISNLLFSSRDCFKNTINKELGIEIVGTGHIKETGLRSYRDQNNNNYHKIYISVPLKMLLALYIY